MSPSALMLDVPSPTPKVREIFVFGSNLAGRHGKGSALEARVKFGARYGVGVGRTGDAYAIPTKDENLKRLTLPQISEYVLDFLCYADRHSDLTFRVVKIGCGLAGYAEKDVRPMFRDAPPNVILPDGWRYVIP